MEAVRVLRGGDRRRAQPFFVVHERRCGFERRRRRSRLGRELDAALVHLRDHPASLIALLLLGNLLSLSDLALTRLSLALGAAEINPVMRHLLADHQAQAAATKVAIVLAVTVAIWTFRHRRRVLAFAVYLPVVYTVLVLYELVGLAPLL